MEENEIRDAIVCARKIEDFLWGEHNAKWGLEEWKRMFRKRAVKISQVDMSNPHWRIELKKRLLQNAALSVALLHKLNVETAMFDGVHPSGVASNLPNFTEDYFETFLHQECGIDETS